LTERPRGPFAPGEEIGGFVIEAIAGRGGMGIVYRAHQKRPDRVVALKVIAPELADDSDFSARFERESAIAAQIEHPNVIPVHAVGDDRGILFIAMRFVPGIDLGKLLGQVGRLEPRRAVELVDQVARALDAAHSHGLVHRDVKPANILLSNADGRDHVYLTDFGLSRHIHGSQGVTRTGTFLGTIDYVAPEQARGERVDARTDVYALGCVLFHALTGTVPFPLESDVAKLYAHGTQRPPSVCARAPEVPAAFDAVLVRAMAKAPDDRYLSAGDLGRAATAAATNVPAPRSETSVATGSAAPPDRTAPGGGITRRTPRQPTALAPARPERRGRRRLGVAVAAVAVVAAASIGALLLTGTTGTGAGTRHGGRGVTVTEAIQQGIPAAVAVGPSIAVRRGPGLTAPITGQLVYRAPVAIVCTAIGDPVRGPYGNSTITTPVWDQLTGVIAGERRFAPDALLSTDKTRLVAPLCSRSHGRSSFHSVVRLRPSVDVQQEPALAARVTARLPYDTALTVVCTAIGDPVSEPPGTPHLTITPVWDKVRAGAVGGYVPDVFVRTPSYRPVAPRC
jgi:hypothetical protein